MSTFKNKNYNCNNSYFPTQCFAEAGCANFRKKLFKGTQYENLTIFFAKAVTFFDFLLVRLNPEKLPNLFTIMDETLHWYEMLKELRNIESPFHKIVKAAISLYFC